jgi:Zn-dependent M28 family amino/carboxypeptidase
MVMEVARLLARQRRYLKRTVRFVAFAAEEVGLLGSHYHAKAHAADLQKARFMLNCDMPSFGTPHGLAFHDVPKGEAYIQRLSDEMGEPLICQNRHHCHSDFYPFILQRVLTAGVASGPVDPPIQHFAHMAADTADKVPVNALAETASFGARVLLRIANDDAWPMKPRSKAEAARWKREGRES